MSSLRRGALTLASAVSVLGLAGNAQAAFTINLTYSGLTASQQTVFGQAKATWESLITGYQTGISLSGIDIAASGANIDGVGGILGQAGPTAIVTQGTSPYRAGGYVLATTGVMQFDNADLSALEANGTLRDVILHEMAHVFGFGTLWTSNNVYVNGTGTFLGTNANAAYRTEYNRPLALGAPVELNGGSGTANGHWNDPFPGTGEDNPVDPLGRPLYRELMTGYLDSPTYISQMTLGSFRDIGFAPVPEPSTIAGMAMGLAGLALRRRRRSAR